MTNKGRRLRLLLLLLICRLDGRYVFIKEHKKQTPGTTTSDNNTSDDGGGAVGAMGNQGGDAIDVMLW